MGDSYIFAIVLIPGLPPLIGEIPNADWNLWKEGKHAGVMLTRPRSMQVQVNQRRQMEIVIGPVYPMLTKQAEMHCRPTAIEYIGDIVNDHCAGNAQLYRDYKEAADAWYKEALAASAGITLAKPGDVLPAK